MKPSLRSLASCFAIACALSACTSAQPKSVGATGPTRSSRAAPAASGGASAGTQGSAVGLNSPVRSGDPAAKGPPPARLPWTPDPIPLTASVTPFCLRPGTTATLNVHTVPRSGIIYQAVYSDNKGGSPPPYGAGYGGNDKGQADHQGDWTNTWVVGAKAPPGRGRVDVIVGTRQGQRGYAGAVFSIADLSGRCA